MMKLAQLGLERSDLELVVAGHWVTVRTTAPQAGLDPLQSHVGRPGLWKVVADRADGLVRCEFDLLAALVDGSDVDADGGEALLADCLRWAAQTADGRRADGWEPPPRAEVESWIPAGGLSLQCGRFVRQGTLHHGPGRLALQFPVVLSVPETLSPPRRAWLRRMLLAAQLQWRMVRLEQPDGGAANAVVDLSGAPHAALPGLIETGLECLRCVVRWLEPADFVVDAAVASCAIEVCQCGLSP